MQEECIVQVPEEPEGGKADLAGLQGDVTDGILIGNLLRDLLLKPVEFECDEAPILGPDLVEVVQSPQLVQWFDF